MGRKANDGRGRIGGRAKGTPNKPPQPAAGWIIEQLNKHRGFIETQLAAPWTETGSRFLSAMVIAAAIVEGKAGTRPDTPPTPETDES